jgi:hypothetical protein
VRRFIGALVGFFSFPAALPPMKDKPNNQSADQSAHSKPARSNLRGSPRMSPLDHFLVLYRSTPSAPVFPREEFQQRLAAYHGLGPHHGLEDSPVALLPSPSGLHFLQAGPFLLAWHGAKAEQGIPFLRILGNPYNVGTARPTEIAAGKVVAAGELDGAFSAFAFDPSTQQGTLLTDRFGLFPLYVHEHDGVLCYSTSLPLLLALCRPKCSIDPLAVHQMLTLRRVLGNRTFFREINLVAPATAVHLRTGPPSQSVYWKWDAIREAANESESDLVAHTYALVEQAILRGVPAKVKQVLLRLGGGLDSRLLAAVLARNGVPVQAWCSDAGSEAVIARAVAQTLGMALRVGPGSPPESIPLAHLASDCGYHVSVLRGWEMARRAAEEGGCDVLFDEPGFDRLLELPQENQEQTAAELAHPLQRLIGLDASLGALLDEPERIAINSAVSDSLQAHVQESIDKAGARASDHFWMMNSFRRYTFGSALSNLIHLPGRYPFVTTRLFEHLIGLPAELRREHRLFHRLFQEVFPDLARIPSAVPKPKRFGLMVEALVRRLSRGRLSLLEAGSFDVAFRRRGPLQDVFLAVLHGPAFGLDATILPEDLPARAVDRHLAGWNLGGLLQGLYTVKHFLARFNNNAGCAPT